MFETNSQVSASGVIQGHHGPLVPFPTMFSKTVLMRQNEYLWSKGLNLRGEKNLLNTLSKSKILLTDLVGILKDIWTSL